MGALGRADAGLITDVKDDFEKKCIILLERACKTLKTKKHVDTEWGEENITANIFTYIHKSQLSIDYDIFIECEHPFFSQAVLDNKKRAKGSPRIDLVFQHNWEGHRKSFYVEAKNLIEHDFTKKGNKYATKAIGVQDRYIKTGIDHYLESHYPKGCILGYVLNGTIANVVVGINERLKKNKRDDEVLNYNAGSYPWICYKSDHAAKSMSIAHYLFDFKESTPDFDSKVDDIGFEFKDVKRGIED